MKKLLYLLSALLLASLIAVVLVNTWQTTDYLRSHGREGTLQINGEYNASRWSSPLPLKKIHVYAGTLSGEFPVIVESDQKLAAKKSYFVRFLTRDAAQAAHEMSIRPLPGSLRLRTSSDGAPVPNDPAQAGDILLAKAMGAPASAPPAQDRISQPAAAGAGAVPFLIGGAQDTTLESIWRNSAPGEWLLLGVAAVMLNMLTLAAWSHPWRERPRAIADEKSFTHPALKTIEPAPPIAPHAPIPLPAADRDAVHPPEPGAADPLLKLPRGRPRQP